MSEWYAEIKLLTTSVKILRYYERSIKYYFLF